MKRKVLAAILAAAMTASLMACGGAAEEEDTTTKAAEADTEAEEEEDTEAEEEEDTEAEEEETEAEEEEEEYDFDGEVVKIYCMAMSDDYDNTNVVAAINEICEEKYGFTIELNQMGIGTYMQQLPLMMSGGESFDLVMCTAIPTCGFTTMQAQGQLMDITEYAEEYAADALELIDKYMPSTTVDGSIYALPCYRQYNSNIYLMMNEDILDTLGLTEDAKACESWTDVEAIFEKVYEAIQNDTLPEDQKVTAVFGPTDNQGTMLTPGSCCLAADNFADAVGFDALGDNYKYVYTDEDGNVYNYFETDEYKQVVSRAYDWYQKGWVYKDALTATDNAGDAGMKLGVFFSYLSTGEFGQEAVKENETGKNLVAIQVGSCPVTTQTGRQWSWAVPATSENPEAACAFLNLMYTDPDIENLLCYGVEGEDYTLNDAGEAVVTENCPYTSSDFFYGNQFLAYPKQGNGTNFREEALANMEEAGLSAYYGLVVSTDDIADTVTNVYEQLQKYQLPLEAAQTDPETAVPQLVEECNNAGLTDIIAYYQAELDEYLGK